MKKLALVCFVAIFCSCNMFSNFGKKVKIKESEVFYKDGATEKDAQALGDWLLENDWFDAKNHKSVQVTKNGDAYVVRLVVDEKKIKGNDAAMLNVWVMQDMISEGVFNNSKTSIILADDHLEDIQKLDPVAAFKPDAQTYIMYNPEEFKKADAKKVADVLDKEGMLAYKAEKRIFLSKKDGANVVRFLMKKETVEKNMEAFLPVYQKTLYMMEKDAFDGDKTSLILTDINFEDFKKVAMPTAEEIQQMQQTNTEQQLVPETNVEEPPPPLQDSSNN